MVAHGLTGVAARRGRKREDEAVAACGGTEARAIHDMQFAVRRWKARHVLN
jgi:hypothetical protein